MKIAITPLYGIGDTLLTTPALRLLKEKRPNDQVVFFTLSKVTHDVLLFNPYIDKLVYFPFLEASLKDVFLFFKKHWGMFDVVINFYPTNRYHYNVFAFLLGAKIRIGHRYLKMDLVSLNFLKQ